MQYKFAHILKIPVKGKGAFSFGKTMHAALQKMFALVAERQGSSQTTLFDGVMVSSSNQDAVALRQAQRDNKTLGELVKPEELDKLYEESWIDDWYENAAVKKAYRDKGRKLLAAYYDKVKDQQIKPVYLEKPFTIKAGDSSFRGAIDRLDECPDGTVKIVDYKTGTPKEAGKMTKDDKEQLLIYQIACLEVLGKKPSALSFVYLENGTEIEFIGKPEELEELREKMARSIGAIKNSEFPADPSEHKCRHCDFREICEFRII